MQTINQKVLIVDDNLGILKMLEKILTKKGYQIETAENGKEGLEKISEFNPAVALIDFKMPKMNGIELIDSISPQNKKNLGIIMMTGYLNDKDIELSYKKGADFFIDKPVNIYILLGTIKRLMEIINYDKILEKTVREKTKELEMNHKNLLKKNNKLEKAHKLLKNTQIKMIQHEKLASVGQLAAGVAHELNNPIGYVNANFKILDQYLKVFFDYITILEKHIPEVNQDIQDYQDEQQLDFVREDAQDLMKESQEGLSRILTIVRNLKDFSRIENETNFKSYNINAGIKSSLNISKNEYKYIADIKKNLQEIPEIECNSGRINQVFLNLIVNASDALKEKYGNKKKGVIEISTSYDENYVICTIEDNGPGIPEENKQKVFDPFFTTKEAGKGTGLGLNISYDIITNNHNGIMELESEEGRGTKFIIKLPLKQNE